MSRKSRQNKSRPIRAAASLPAMNPHAAGIDVGATQMFVCVPPDSCTEPIWIYDTFTPDLLALADRFKECGMLTVAMESTGVYWIPLYQILEDRGFAVTLVNPGYRKSYTLKTDVEDCQKLQYLHSVGLLTGSFRPDQQVCAIRSVMRHRSRKVQEAASHVQRMQKSLDQMNVRLHNVITDITGSTGLAIIDAILAGKRDPHLLALYRDPRVKATADEIAKSLIGDYRPEHLFTLAQSLESYRFCQAQIAKCDAQMGEMLAEFDSQSDITPPDEPKTPPTAGPTPDRMRKGQVKLPSASLTDEMHRLFGVDLTRVPGFGSSLVFALFTELGADMSAFASSAHFASYIAVCPQNQVSGGKVLSKGTRNVKSRLSVIFRLAARSIARDHSYLGECYRRIKTRLSAAQANMAIAHKLARIIYHLLTKKEEYNADVFDIQVQRFKQKRLKRIQKEAAYLGLTIAPA